MAKLDFPCPGCAKWIAVPGQYAGKKGRCPACNRSTRVPLASLERVARAVEGPSVRTVEAAIAADTPEPLRLLALEPFLAWLAEEARTTAIADGQTLQLGWTLLECRVVESRLLLLAPDLRAAPVGLQPDLSQAVWTIFAHQQVPASFTLLPGEGPIIPTQRQAAVVGPRWSERPSVMERSAPQADDDSGWTFNSLRPEVDNNDPDGLGRLSLYEVALASPAVLPYLSLPPGFSVVFDPERAPGPVVLRGQTPLQPLAGSYVASLL